MKPQIIAQAAEAIILREGNKVTKRRIAKGYRIPELDEKLRKLRTRQEAKLLEKAENIISVPKLIKVDEKSKEIEMEFINGDKLSEKLSTYAEKKQIKIMKQVGQETGKLHDANIIHGDLTTSNMILKDNKVYIIDFGLGYQNGRVEDKAVDLHLIKQALEAKHFQNHEKLFKSFLQGYSPKDKTQVLKQLKKVESRGRNKH